MKESARESERVSELESELAHTSAIVLGPSQVETDPARSQRSSIS